MRVRFFLLFIVTFLVNKSLFSQQMTVDDAEITTHRSFQIEAWYGTIDSWVLPAITPLSFLEISAGAGFNTEEGFSHKSYLFETKFAPEFSHFENNMFSFVTGLLTNPALSTKSIYAYIPYSREILNNNSLLHFNIGYSLNKDNSWLNEFFYGIRGDIELFQTNIFLLSEVFASNFELPGYQAGLRFIIIDDLLEIDITYGSGLEKEENSPGLNFGLAFTPSPIW